VVQLLSVQVTGLTVTSVAGSRTELQGVAERVSSVMDYHVRTLRPAIFRVPSRAWDFRVYVTAMPQMGWDVSSTSYPYQLQMEVDEDLTGVQEPKLEAAALLRLYQGIGYDPSVHGGDATGFNKIVQTVLKSTGSVSGDAGGRGQESTSQVTPGSTTSSIKEVWDAVYRQFPRTGSAGIFCCRPIGGSHCNYTSSSSGWSQHAYGNGWDITAPGGLSQSTPSQNYLDMVEKWLLQNIGKGLRLPIAQVIWRGREVLSGSSVDDHFSHIHVSGDPMFSGTPLCAGG